MYDFFRSLMVAVVTLRYLSDERRLVEITDLVGVQSDTLGQKEERAQQV